MTKPTGLFLRRRLRALVCLLCLSALPVLAADAVKTFNVPAGDAIATLKQAAQQAGVEIMFPSENVSGVKTAAVNGEFTPLAALKQMLSGTGLVAMQDATTGALAVRRDSDPNAQRVAPKAAKSDHPEQEAKADDVVQNMTAVEVTGSHIKRLEGEGPQPIASYSAGEIEDRGYQTVGDFMQSLSFNSGTVNTIDLPSGVAGTPYARGATTMNPRGLGAQRFLVLLNGQRAVNYGTPDSSGDSVFDFNSIPAGAIESIDYLKDGASAIYGSDAITGVMNIKLKKSYSGFTSSIMAGNTVGQGADTFTRSINVLAGTSSQKTSVMVDATWFRQNDNLSSDYSRSKTTDYRFLGPVKGVNDNSLGNFPFNINLSAAQATVAGLAQGAGYYVVTGGQQVAAPSLANFTFVGASGNVPNANLYDFGPVTQLTPKQDNLGLLATFQHEISDKLTVYGQILASDNKSNYLYTPGSITATSIITSSGATLVIPANNPYNPFGVALNNFRGRAIFGPTRKFDVEAAANDFVVGLDGKIGADWNWTTSLNYGSNLVSQVARNQQKSDDLQSALNGTLAGHIGSFLNPFGPSSDQGLVNALFVIGNSSARASGVDYELSASGRLFKMPALLNGTSAGDVALAAGVEWRRENLDNNADPTNYAVNSGATPFTAGRRVYSGYLELDVPVLPKYLEFQLAARHDNYSDFGSTNNPKLAFVSQPFSFLKLRGSYSQSFKAPDLAQLNTLPTTTYSLNFTDPLRPQDGVLSNVKILTGGNSQLQPEKGKVWYFGGVLDADKVVKGLSFSADYFRFNISNVITSFSNTAILFTSFPNLVVRDNSKGTPGPIQYFNEVPINAAAYYWRGADLGLNYRLPKTVIGNFDFNVQATRIIYIAYDGGTGAGPLNAAGLYNYPRWTGNAQINWSKGDFGAGLGARYLGEYLNNSNAPAFVWGENPIALFNATVSYSGLWGSKIILGCNNLLGQDPPPNGRASPSDGFDISTYSAWSLGRFVYVKLEKKF
jgi:outer membrane receptor protein involved in Fe transport